MSDKYGPDDYKVSSTGQWGPEMKARAIDWSISHSKIVGIAPTTNKKKKKIKR